MCICPADWSAPSVERPPGHITVSDVNQIAAWLKCKNMKYPQQWISVSLCIRRQPAKTSKKNIYTWSKRMCLHKYAAVSPQMFQTRKFQNIGTRLLCLLLCNVPVYWQVSWDISCSDTVWKTPFCCAILDYFHSTKKLISLSVWWFSTLNDR